jgi:branched-chain amino acid transport system substrate-binding protein
MKKIILLALALSAAFTLTGRTQAAAVRFGIIGPISGPNADFGAQLKIGTQQAVDDINAAGGILGQNIALSYGDDMSDPTKGMSIASKYADADVKFVIGPVNSGLAIPVSEFFQRSGVLMITPSATNPKITERGLWNVFRTCGRDDQQGLVAANYIFAKFKGKRIAIVHDKTSYGLGLAAVTKKALNNGSVNEVLYEGVDPGEKSYSALVSKIKASGADLVYWGGLHTDAALIVRQMRGQGIKAPLMSGDGLATDEFASLGGPSVEGTLMTFQPDFRKRPEAAAIVKKFRDKNFEPEGYTLYSYAAIEVIKQAAEHARSLDPRKVAEAIHSGMTFKTVIGEISYDKNGDITRPDYVMYVWKKQPDGKITYVDE